MPAKLPINLQDLLRQRTVEGERIEYKAGWNPDATLRTLCAFANDFANLGGGYVVVGQACDENGQPVFPPAGLAANQLDKIQRELLAHCQLIQPPYFPVLSVEEVDGRQLIVLWAPGGQNRPYKELELTEGRSTGVPKILKAMAANGSPPPMFETDEDRAAYVIRLPVHPLAQAPEAATPQVTPQVPTTFSEQVLRLLKALKGEMSRQELQEALQLNDIKHFREAFLQPALDAGLVEMTLPQAPRSSRQRYRATGLGEQLRGRL
jgi:predicted HTH transcriptional regulator